MSTTLALNREDSGKSIRLALGDTIQVTLPEMDPLAAWKAEVDTSVLAYAQQADQDSYWLLGEDLQTFVRVFEARAEGETDLVLTCQKIGETRVDVLDVWRVHVVVGNPARRKAAPVTPAAKEAAAEPAPAAGDMVVILFEVLLLAMAAFMLAFRLAILAFNTSTSDTLFGLLGIIGAGTVTIYVAHKIVFILLSRAK